MVELVGHVNCTDSNRKVSKVFNNSPQGNRQRGRPKNRWQKCVKTDINKCKITNWKERSRSSADSDVHAGGKRPHWTILQQQQQQQHHHHHEEEEEMMMMMMMTTT